MTQRLTIKDHQKEKALFQQRLLLIAAGIILLTLLLFIRLAILQIEHHTTYTTLSKKNQFALLPIEPNRGLIFDRNGILLAQNIPVYSLEINPEKVHDIPATIAALQKIIPISNDDVQSFYKQLKQRARFHTVPLRLKLDETEVAKFYINQYLFPGVIIHAQLIRYYPLGSAMVDVIGYVGRINQRELNKLDPSNYIVTNYVGKVGIERSMESSLHGQVGHQQVETDASNHIVRVLKRTPPQAGTDIYLTIDSKLQLAAKQALAETNERGAVVAIDPNNGEVLALASSPSYDPNLFVHGFTSAAYARLQNSPDRPLFNRAIRGQYPPASTIKPFLGLEGLASHVITTHSIVNDPGWFQLPNTHHVYRDWRPQGHGKVNLRMAITVSCDTFFYDLATKLGIQRIDDIMEQFGFGQLTHVELNEEVAGLVPSPEWKYANQGQHWYKGDTIIAGIGQGFSLVTPLQLASATATLANHGIGYQPHVILKQHHAGQPPMLTQPKELAPIAIDTTYWNTIISDLQNVIESPYGTGHRFGRPPYTVAAKTGTAQLYSNNEQNDFGKDPIPTRLRDNSLMIAFAPAHHPKIAVAVITENTYAAPIIARKVLDNYLLRTHHEKARTAS